MREVPGGYDIAGRGQKQSGEANLRGEVAGRSQGQVPATLRFSSGIFLKKGGAIVVAQPENHFPLLLKSSDKKDSLDSILSFAFHCDAISSRTAVRTQCRPIADLLPCGYSSRRGLLPCGLPSRTALGRVLHIRF